MLVQVLLLCLKEGKVREEYWKLSHKPAMAPRYRGRCQLVQLLIILLSGITCSGAAAFRSSDVPNTHKWRLSSQLMNLYFKVLLVLVLGSGNPGHPENAVSSSGWWWRIIAVGQPIAWHDEVSLILRSAHFVINNQDHPTPFGVMRVCQAILVLPFLQKVGLAVLCPQPLEISFDDRLIGGAELALL